MSAIDKLSDYMKLYNYLPVLDEQQIIKLRRIATGILSLSAFTEEEMNTLDNRLLTLQQS